MEIVNTYIVMFSRGMEKPRPAKLHKTENNKYYIDMGQNLLEVSYEQSKSLLKL